MFLNKIKFIVFIILFIFQTCLLLLLMNKSIRSSNIIHVKLAQVLISLVDAVEQSGRLVLLVGVNDLRSVLQHHLH